MSADVDYTIGPRRGQLGGSALFAARGPQYMAEIGRRGGRRTATRHGSEHMRQIGKLGFQATVDRYWAGDRRRAAERLAELGRMALDVYILVGGEKRWLNGAWRKPRRDGEPW